MVAETASPGGAGPVRSVNTPTTEAQVGVGEGCAARARRVLEPDEVGEGRRAEVTRCVDTADATCSRGTDRHVAVGDVHALGDDDEQRLQIGALA